MQTIWRAARRAWLLVILGVFVAGLVLPIWWLVKRPVGHLPGLGAYPSAYIGDTVLLPLGCMILVIGSRSLRPARGERVTSGAAAVVAGAAAIAVQAAWLRDPSPRLNWTLPHAGRFNAGGWWHAVYFTAMSAVVLALSVIFLMRVRDGRRTDPESVKRLSGGPGAVVVLTAFGAYAALVVHDNFSASITRSSASSLVLTSAAALIAGLLVAIMYGRAVVELVRPALIAIGGAAVIATFVATPWHGRTLLNAESAAVACTVAAVGIECHLVRVARDGPGSGRSWSALGIGVTAGALVSAWLQLVAPLSGHDAARVALIATVGLIVLVGVLFGFLGPEAIAVLPVTFVGLLVIAVASAAAWYQAALAHPVSATNAAVTIVTILVGLVIGLSSYVVKVRTDGVLGVPPDAWDPGPRLGPSVALRTSAALALISFFAVGGFLATFAFVVAVNRDLPFPARSALAGSDIRVFYVGVAAFILSATVFAIKTWRPASRIAQVCATGAQLAIPLAVSGLLIADTRNGRFSGLQVIEAVCVAVLMFLWTFNSVVNNAWLMQGRRMSVGAVVAALSLAVLSGTTGAWLLTSGIVSGINARGPWQAATFALTALVASGGVVIFLGGSGSIGLPHHTELPVWRGLLQDTLSCSAITLVLVFPVVYLWSITDFSTGLVAALPVVAIFAPPFMWIMKANREHPKVEALRLIEPKSKAEMILADMEARSVQRFVRDQLVLLRAVRNPCEPKSEDFIRTLAAHTRNQNRLAGSMIVIPVAGALQILLSLAADSLWLVRHLTQIVWPAAIRGAIAHGAEGPPTTSKE